MPYEQCIQCSTSTAFSGCWFRHVTHSEQTDLILPPKSITALFWMALPGIALSQESRNITPWFGCSCLFVEHYHFCLEQHFYLETWQEFTFWSGLWFLFGLGLVLFVCCSLVLFCWGFFVWFRVLWVIFMFVLKFDSWLKKPQWTGQS